MEETESNAEDKYGELRAKYGLPEYGMLNYEYELEGIEQDDLILKNIRKKIAEKMEFMVGVLQWILQPDTELSALHEAEFFTEDEKEEIIKIYKKLMYYCRYSTRLTVDDSDKENAEFILEADKEIRLVKPNLIVYFDKLKESWTKEISKKDNVGYFGWM